jgi:hypothetical protein
LILARLDEHVECSARFPTFEIDLKNAPSVSFFGSIFSWSICYFYAPLAIAVAVVTLIAGYLMKGNAEILSDVLDHLGVSCRHFTGSDTRSLSPYKAHRSAPRETKGCPAMPPIARTICYTQKGTTRDGRLRLGVPRTVLT